MNRYDLDLALQAYGETREFDITRLIAPMFGMLAMAVFIPLYVGFPVIVAAAWFGLVSFLICPDWAQSILHHHSLWFWLPVVPVLGLATPLILSWQSGNRTQSSKSTPPAWIAVLACGLVCLLRFAFAGLALSDCFVLSAACAFILPTALQLIVMWWIITQLRY